MKSIVSYCVVIFLTRLQGKFEITLESRRVGERHQLWLSCSESLCSSKIYDVDC